MPYVFNTRGQITALIFMYEIDISIKWLKSQFDDNVYKQLFVFVNELKNNHNIYKKYVS